MAGNLAPTKESELLEDGLQLKTGVHVQRNEEDRAPKDEASEEDVDGEAETWRGWLGRGPPRRSTYMGKQRIYTDGGGLCSPGRWHPSKRALPEIGQTHLIDGLRDMLSESMRKTMNLGLVSFMVRVMTGKKVKSPFDVQLLARARQAIMDFFGIPDSVGDVAEGQCFRLGSIGAVLRALGDPDASFIEDLAGGDSGGGRPYAADTADLRKEDEMAAGGTPRGG